MASQPVGTIDRVDQLTGHLTRIEVSVADLDHVTKAAANWQAAAMFNWQAIHEYWPERVVLCAATATAPVDLLQLDEDYVPFRSRVPDRRGVYVSFLEVAPQVRNKSQYGFTGLGAGMLGFAVERSLELGHAGRVGLHSVSQAREFYARLGFSESTETGPNEYWETYLELSPEAAGTFLERTVEI